MHEQNGNPGDGNYLTMKKSLEAGQETWKPKQFQFKMGDLLADDSRAILLVILEENEEQRLYVGKQPEGMHLGYVLVLHTLIYVLTQVWIGLSKESMAIVSYVLSISLRTMLPCSPASPQPVALLVYWPPCLCCLTHLMWFISLLLVWSKIYIWNLLIESGRAFQAHWYLLWWFMPQILMCHWTCNWSKITLIKMPLVTWSHLWPIYQPLKMLITSWMLIPLCT